MSWMPSLCGKQLIQSIKLYTISTMSLWGYVLKGSWFAIACTLTLIVQMNLSKAGTCSFLLVILKLMSLSENIFYVLKLPNAMYVFDLELASVVYL